MFLLKIIFKLGKLIFRTFIATIGFVAVMAMIPGTFLFMYLFEPHRPLPVLATHLPADNIEAAMVMSTRIDNALRKGVTEPELIRSLKKMGFEVFPEKKHAIFDRRQMNCVETYAVLWRTEGTVVIRGAGIVEESCPGMNRNILRKAGL